MNTELKVRVRTKIRLARHQEREAARNDNFKAFIAANNKRMRIQKMLDIACGHGRRHGVMKETT